MEAVETAVLCEICSEPATLMEPRRCMACWELETVIRVNFDRAETIVTLWAGRGDE